MSTASRCPSSPRRSRRPGGLRPQPQPLRDVDAEHEAERQADHRDDEEADDPDDAAEHEHEGRDAGLRFIRRPGPGMSTCPTTRTSTDHGDRPRDRGAPTTAHTRTAPPTSQSPGRTGTIVPTIPTRQTRATRASPGGHALRGKPTMNARHADAGRAGRAGRPEGSVGVGRRGGSVRRARSRPGRRSARGAGAPRARGSGGRREQVAAGGQDDADVRLRHSGHSGRAP